MFHIDQLEDLYQKVSYIDQMPSDICSVDFKYLLTGLLGLYWQIGSPILFVRPELARAVRKLRASYF